MLKIGEFQKLTIERTTPVGLYLADESKENEVLLPVKYIRSEMKEGEEVEAFIYKDGEGRFVATTERPFLTIGQYACLDVFSIDRAGAFMEWGLEKHLLVPHKNQAVKMQSGKSYIVYLYEDELTNRLVGTTRINSLLKQATVDDLKVGDEVNLLVRGDGELGVNLIVNDRYMGMIYTNELYEKLYMGDKLKGYVKQVRNDHKLDISLNPIGYASVEPNATIILEELQFCNGFLTFNDKSDADEIKERFGMSKKLFKKALGQLYKQKRINIENDGIRLLDD